MTYLKASYRSSPIDASELHEKKKRYASPERYRVLPIQNKETRWAYNVKTWVAP